MTTPAAPTSVWAAVSSDDGRLHCLHASEGQAACWWTHPAGPDVVSHYIEHAQIVHDLDQSLRWVPESAWIVTEATA